jgi:hypothetical protein
MIKRIGVYFSSVKEAEHPLHKEESLRSYGELTQEIERLDGELYILTGKDSYQGGLNFATSQRYQKGQLTDSGSVSVDLIFNKSNTIFDTDKVVNHPDINALCTDKLRTFELFSDISPRTTLVQKAEDLPEALRSVPGSQKVIKPRSRSYAIGVYIGSDEYLLQQPHRFPVLVQEFVDSSAGIPGIVTGVHDMRLVMVDGEVALSVVRTPPAGSLITNVARGGSLHMLAPHQIPPSAMTIASTVDTYMRRFRSRIFSVDMAFTDGGPKLIELNSKPNIWENSRGEPLAEFKRHVAVMLMAA